MRERNFGSRKEFKDFFRCTADESPGRIKLFFDTMIERQNIYIRRFIEKKDPPWTTDPIFYNKFTNVYRELDRNTIYLKENIISQDIEKRDLFFKMMFFRLFNNVETLTFPENPYPNLPTCEEYNWKVWADYIGYLFDRYRHTGYCKAYHTGCYGTFTYSRKEMLCNIQPNSIIDNIENICNAKTAQDYIREVSNVIGIGRFNSYEFFLDVALAGFFNENDYWSLGGGAERGLKCIFPNVTSKNMKDHFLKLVDMEDQYLQDFTMYRDGKFLPYKKHIHYHRVEFWLCEFSKYMQLLAGKLERNRKHNYSQKHLLDNKV